MTQNSKHKHFQELSDWKHIALFPKMVPIMKNRALAFIALSLVFIECKTKPADNTLIKALALDRVRVADNFWAPRLETNRLVTIPHCFNKIRESGTIDNFTKAAHLIDGPHLGRSSGDAELYKTMEGAYYTQLLYHSTDFGSMLDSLCILIAEAQEEDGYLFTARTIDPTSAGSVIGPKRWSALYSSHELYNAGHLYEAAVAASLAGRNDLLLDVAKKNADLLERTFGSNKLYGIPGHQEVELGLIRLYRLTGEERYLRLAEFFLHARGQGKSPIPSDSLPYYQYNQNHLPVGDQCEAVGHAVRATYMYAAMTDVAAILSEYEFAEAVEKIWWDIICKKMYITGGIGGNLQGESFSKPYDLPNTTAYNETCAAIGLAMFTQRLFLLHGDARFLDVLERLLYNAVPAGIGLHGDRFFYVNPLESDGLRPFNKGVAARKPWFSCPCCPTNIARFIPSIPGLIYAKDKDGAYVNLFVAGAGEIPWQDHLIRIEQKTDYPWDGRIKLFITPDRPVACTIKIRIPGWVRHEPVPGNLYTIQGEDTVRCEFSINNRPINPTVTKGFALFHRKWYSGDSIAVTFSMPVRIMAAHPGVAENMNKVAIERGPILYCAEEADNGNLSKATISTAAHFHCEHHPDLLGGVTLIKSGRTAATGPSQEMTLVPYAVWSNRTVGAMKVWLPLCDDSIQSDFLDE